MTTEPLPNIKFDDFAKLDLRVATILSAEAHPNADKLLKIRLDDGTPEGRQVCAGIKAWYDPATLVGMQVIICANLEPRQLRGEISQGMILAASDMKIVALAPVELIAAVDGAAAPAAIPAAAPAATVAGLRARTSAPEGMEENLIPHWPKRYPVPIKESLKFQFY